MGNTHSYNNGEARCTTPQSPPQAVRKMPIESPLEMRMREASGGDARVPTDTPASSTVEDYEALLSGLIMKNGTCAYNEERARSAATAVALAKLSNKPGVAPSLQRSEALAQTVHACPLADQGARAKDTIQAALCTLYAEETRASAQLQVIHGEISGLTNQWRISIRDGDGAATKTTKFHLERAIRRYKKLESMMEDKRTRTNMLETYLGEVEMFISSATSSAMIAHVQRDMPDIAAATRLAADYSKTSAALDDRAQEMRRTTARISRATKTTGLDVNSGGIGQAMDDEDIMAELDIILGVVQPSEEEEYGLGSMEDSSTPLDAPNARSLAETLPDAPFSRPEAGEMHEAMPDVPSAKPRAPVQIAQAAD